MPRQTPARLLDGPIGWWRSLVVCRSWARRGCARGLELEPGVLSRFRRAGDRWRQCLGSHDVRNGGCPICRSASSFDWEI